MSHASALGTRPAVQDNPSQPWVRASTIVAAMGYAACLLWLPGRVRILAPFVILDVAGGLLLWRIDRQLNSLRGRLMENFGYLTTFILIIATLAVFSPALALTFGPPYWYLAGLGSGLLLIWLSGMRVSSLLSGELAFLAGPKPWGAAIVSTAAITSGAVAEEALYRGGAIGAAGLAIVPIAILGALTFCGKHHLPGWAANRWNRRTLSVEIVSAVIFLVLVIASHSLYPAILAHIVNNLPSVVLQVQRARSASQEHFEIASWSADET